MNTTKRKRVVYKKQTSNNLRFKRKKGKFSNRYKKISQKNNNFRRNNKRFSKKTSFNPARFINLTPTNETSEVYKSKYFFNDFDIDKRLVKTIQKNGLERPFPIQDEVIPLMLKDNDVIGLAETGTGKTAAFLIPLIDKTIKNPSLKTLILAPTRELAIQIEKELFKLTKGFRLTSVVCVGGTNIKPQINILRRNNTNFIIGTPGRVMDLMSRKCFDPKKISLVVLDEADRMLDMGFIHDMKKIISQVSKDRKTFLFSATMTKDSEKVMKKFLNNPVIVSVKKKDVTDTIKQDVVKYSSKNKYDTLVSTLTDEDFKRVLIFGSMKHRVEKLSRQLVASGFKAESIHGNKSHGQRQRALSKFKNGKISVLVATDVAARGIHVDDISHVINYDLPNTFDDYVHRIGRTGRGTSKGKALTFVPKK